MKANILAIGGSNSRNSINKILASYASSRIENANVLIADLNDFELPLYSSDIEKASGIPENAVKFMELIKSADGIVLSLAEHNGAFSVAFKNIFDWMSRIDKNVWQNKPMLLMATSPGSRGGANVLRITRELLPYFGGNIVADFSLPSFYENFSHDGLKNLRLNDSLNQKISLLQEAIASKYEILIK